MKRPKGKHMTVAGPENTVNVKLGAGETSNTNFL
jgi:hypothetical protein